MHFKKSFMRVKQALMVAVLCVATSACGPSTVQFVNTDITGSALNPAFTLTNIKGETRTLDSYRGKAVVLFFGFTHCPDICPTTLQYWAQIRAALGTKADKLQVVFVTLDPARDTPALLGQYVPRFDPTFEALRGEGPALQSLLEGLRVFARKVPLEANTTGNSATAKTEQYTMDHSTSSFVIDPEGRLRLLIRHEADPKSVVHDIEQLLKT